MDFGLCTLKHARLCHIGNVLQTYQ